MVLIAAWHGAFPRKQPLTSQAHIATVPREAAAGPNAARRSDGHRANGRTAGGLCQETHTL
eukprot:4487675-Prymnesium_polylepis.1